MIERIIEYSVRNQFIVIMLALVVAALGIYSLIHTPVDAIPDLSENQVIVFADWPGRSPREVEDQVTYPLSVNLQGLAGIKAVRATSEFGFSMINLIFQDNVEFYFARQRVLERLSIASTFLPAGVMAYMAPDATALGQIFWYTVEGDGYDLGRLRAIQDWFVRYQLYSVPGVAEVASVGGYPIEYQVDVDPNKLRAYGVTLGELFTAVGRSNASVGGRVIQKANAEYLVRGVGWITSVQDVEDTVIKSLEGTPIFVKNIATVQLGSAYRRTSLEKDGNEAVGGVVLMRYGENPLEVTRRIKAKIEQLQAGLPPGIRIVPFYERTRLIEEAIHTVRGTLIEETIVASLAVILVLWHFRSALVVCATLPLAMLISFILMRYFGVASNIMSLSGIAISIGVLVDSSIVMVENATHHLYEHFGNSRVRGDTRELVLPALRTVGRPIFFSVIIMLISFVPVFALGGMEGRMFRPLAFTKSFAMLGVAIMAITLVPALIPTFVRGRLRSEEDSWIVRSVIEIYRPVLRFLLDHPWPIFWFTSVLFLFGLAPVGSQTLSIGVLALTAAATMFAVRDRDEDSFRRHWRTVTFLWIAVCAVAAWFGPYRLLPARGNISLPMMDGPIETSRVLFTLAATAVAVVPIVLLIALLGYSRLLARCTLVASLVIAAFGANQHMTALGREFMPPLDEGSILDMPTTVPRASVTQAADDLKARDRLLHLMPEVELVVGKAGRAESPTDPAPPDMIETVVNLRPREYWPKRKLRYEEAIGQSETILDSMIERHWISAIDKEDNRIDLINGATMDAVTRFDQTTRDLALRRNAEFEHELAPELASFAVAETIRVVQDAGKLTNQVGVEELDSIKAEAAVKFGRSLAAAPDIITITQLAEGVAARLVAAGSAEPRSDLLVLSPGLAVAAWQSVSEVMGLEKRTFFTRLLDAVQAHRNNLWVEHTRKLNWELFDLAGGAYSWYAIEELTRRAGDAGLFQRSPTADELKSMRAELATAFTRKLLLWRKTKDDLLKEMDTAIQVPGWGNIWTQPIINRVDMLATGVRTMIGVKVYGNDLDQIQKVSNEVAAVLKSIPGAVDVFPDQVVGAGYLEIAVDRQKAARYGVSVADVQDVIETALGGRMITMTVEGRERFPVRIRYARAFREDEEKVRELLVNATGGSMAGDASMPTGGTVPSAGPVQVPMSQVADVRIVEGPSMIKSENGLLRAYVQLNVRDRDVVGFVNEAQRAVAEQVKLPTGMYLEWSGQFEHQVRARKTLQVIMPIVILLIFVILYITYNDLADACLMMFAVPGAVAGGVLFQWLFGFNFSVAVWVGFIACFGLATETGIVMLVYLREAVEKAGGLANISLDQLKQAVIHGAVHRLRPKLLTEGTTIIGLAPMLWATGTGAEIMRPMAAPVLGGILVADEVIDLLLPVLFFWVRKRRWQKIHSNENREGAEPAIHTVSHDTALSLAGQRD